MLSVPPVIVVLSIVALLGAAAFSTLVLLIISIRRTSRAPLSEIHNDRVGRISRRVLTGGRTARREDHE
jgi:hypothetical protein